ncbi:TetR/AcrR family transcriptional regulator [Chromobacterium violaceum]|uniref:TetR/AcrR family transcriptional regulator n=1 Tax=Chromobacterium violaceum TaxID=536 RepID=UPI001B33363F|nr:TetR/AcrR family transcriptional regulator [Chromobacterium violaceum]MBP4044267.1 TetR/AcrR family transcriptional regulator [Chromobacterium violaceum]
MPAWQVFRHALRGARFCFFATRPCHFPLFFNLILNERSFINILGQRSVKHSEALVASKRQQQTDSRRAQIVEAALACFVSSGFHQTGMRDIADAAGVSLGNLYNHFPNKQALIAEIAALEALEKQALMDALAADPARQAIRSFAERYLRLCERPEDVSLTAEVLAEAARNAELAAMFAANRRQLADALADALRRGAAQGEIDGSLPFSACAHWLLDALEGCAINRTLLGARLETADILTLIDKLLSTAGGTR